MEQYLGLNEVFGGYASTEGDYVYSEEWAEHYNQQSMEFNTKSVTPFEHGGFDMHNGNSFNMDFGHGPGMF